MSDTSARRRRPRSKVAIRLGVRLYRDNLEEIMQAVRSTLSEDDDPCLISSGDWEYESVEELVTREGEVTLPECTLGQALYGTKVLCGPGGVVTVQISNRSDVQQRGAFAQIMEVVERQQTVRGRFIQWLRDHPRAFGIVFGIVLGGYVLSTLQTIQGFPAMFAQPPVPALVGSLVVGVVLVLWAASIFFDIPGGGMVSLKRRRDAPNFVQRNGDQLWVGAVLTVIAFLLGRISA